MALASSSAAPATEAEDEIAFFDVETSVLANRWTLLEFGAVVVCPRRLVEVSSYSTLVRPADPDAVPPATTARCNGITRDAVARAPPFRDVADAIYGILNGRVWAGHNVERFDSVIIREAFDEIGRPPPQPRGMIDTLPLLTQRFGRRAGDMKMASLANYFGLGRQRHRSLDDVRMNIDILKYCATVLLLEASPRKAHAIETLLEGAITRNQDNRTPPPELPNPEAYSQLPGSLKRKWTVSPVDGATIDEDNHDPARDMVSSELVTSHGEKMMLETAMQMDAGASGYSGFLEPEDAGPSGYSGFLEPDDVSTECIKIAVGLFHRFGPRTVIQYKGAPLQLYCTDLRVRFGVIPRFFDAAGRPKLNIMVDIPENLTKILGLCDSLAQWSSPEGCSDSKWIPLIKRYGYPNCPSVRLNIPIIGNGDNATYATHMYQKGRNGDISKLTFRNVDPAELDSLLRGNKVDAFFSLETFDYLQSAGIRLVAKRLDVHFKWLFSEEHISCGSGPYYRVKAQRRLFD